MMVKVHTDNHIVGKQDVLDQVEAMVRQSFTGFEDQLTRCEVYLSDDNGPKSTGDDIRCVVEVHPAGAHRMAVTQNAGGLFEAVDAACEKMHRMLAERVDRLHNPKGRTPMGGVPEGASASGGMSQGRRAAETD